MPALSTRPSAPPARASTANRLDAASFATLALLPLTMALANKSAPATLVVAALLAGAARLAEGTGRQIVLRAGLLARDPFALGCAALAAYGLLTIAWSQHDRVSLHAFGELALPAAAALLLHLALPRPIPRWAVSLAAIAATIGCFTIVAELASGLALRRDLGLRSAPFIFKRSITCTAILFWPLAAALARQGRTTIAVALGLLVTIAIVAAHSGAALFGLLFGSAVLLVAWIRPRFALGLTGAMLLGSLIMAPIVGDLAKRTFSEPVLDALERVQMRDRILIWQSFAAAWAERPVLGTGFGTSPVLGRDPVANEVPENRRLMLAVGHPHNGFLQIWTEGGLIGALGAAAVFAGLLRRLWRKPVAIGPKAATLVCAAAIMLVGHGAWQGWWIATLGAAAVWFARLPREGSGVLRGAAAQASGGSAGVPRKPSART